MSHSFLLGMNFFSTFSAFHFFVTIQTVPTMGAYLTRPEMGKSHEEGENNFIRFASTSMQGWRTHQEDAHNCIVDFWEDCSFFAVYDGHGGSEVSTYLKNNFPAFLKDHKLLKHTTDDGLVAALHKLFVKFDDTLRHDETVKLMAELKAAAANSNPSKQQQQPLTEQCDREEKEQKERESLLEEAYALSQEANISIEQIIKQYAKCRNKLLERVAEQISEQQPQDISDSNDSSNNALDNSSISKSGRKKRPLVFISPQLRKRVKMQQSTEGDNGNDTEQKQQQQMDSECGLDESKQMGKRRAKTGNEENGHGDNAAETAPYSSTSDTKAVPVEEEDEEEDDPDYKEESVKMDGEETTSTEEEENGEAAETEEEEEETGNEEEEEEEETEEEELEMLFNSSEGNKAGFDSGSTACVTLLFKDKIVVANIGDSRCVLCRAGKAVELSADHKPEDVKEKERIEAAGGSVSEDGRVNGGLNLTRAFGDHFYKQTEQLSLKDQMITALPDVTITERDSDADEFIIVACDGIWNSMSSQEACDFVMERIGTNTLKEIGANMCDHCCAKDTSGDGSGCDNETVILIDLKKATRSAPCANSTKQEEEATH